MDIYNHLALHVFFFKSESGNEPVRDWLKDLPAIERRAIGEDMKTVQFGWPLVMPLVRKMGKALGSAYLPSDSNCPCFIHRQRGHHGAASWVHQKIH